MVLKMVHMGEAHGHIADFIMISAYLDSTTQIKVVYLPLLVLDKQQYISKLSYVDKLDYLGIYHYICDQVTYVHSHFMVLLLLLTDIAKLL